MKIGITGGIGSGKSYVCDRLKSYGINVYDCDAAAKNLLATSCQLKTDMCNLIGNDAYKDGALNKKVVTEFLLASEDNAQKIDNIVHPTVARDFITSGLQWMECAIMFESGFDRLVDKIICVTSPENVRVDRIMKRDGISREKALQWMGRQWSQDKILSKSDFEIVNDGKTNIDIQIKNILNII
jgi:dephospho-CoA kinase